MMSGGYWLAIHKCNIEIIINFFRQPASLPNVIGQFEPEITEYTVVCQQTALENPIRIEVMSFVTVSVLKLNLFFLLIGDLQTTVSNHTPSQILLPKE